LCGLGGFLRVRMNAGQRIVPIDDAKPLGERPLKVSTDLE
jgi:hypothetical protein